MSNAPGRISAGRSARSRRARADPRGSPCAGRCPSDWPPPLPSPSAFVQPRTPHPRRNRVSWRKRERISWRCRRRPRRWFTSTTAAAGSWSGRSTIPCRRGEGSAAKLRAPALDSASPEAKSPKSSFPGAALSSRLLSLSSGIQHRISEDFCNPTARPRVGSTSRLNIFCPPSIESAHFASPASAVA
jgi:hypothetical protein